MKTPKTPEALLRQIAHIPRMERGKLCPMQRGAYYNHQTWQKGRNVVRYVPRERIAALQEAIDGYQRYVKLTTAYADAIIRRTRQARPATPPTSKQSKKH